ncbi:YcaO-like family protein [Halobacillus litoralis]|uniref:YcaO domain-containing protein n=1 Tax=Halobacillus litoralis TaxID=45668 RepID=A0A410MC59_9BACI|nr:YcaO-like family protein [Halobacillus litoralis]QAS52235.1 hypothetical protein HLI_08325 [Halobacillus litoralis]
MTIQILDPSLEKEQEIPIYKNNAYIFVGPLRNKDHFCFQCFQDRLKEVELDSHYFTYPSTMELQASEHDIVTACKNKLKENEEVPSLYIIHREKLKVELQSTFKRGDCKRCGTDEPDLTPKVGEGTFTKHQLRHETFEKVQKRLEKFRPLLFGNRPSLINQITRAGDSYGTPMVQSEVLYKGTSMLSFGRTVTYAISKYTSILESIERYATAYPYKKSTETYQEGESAAIDLTLSEVMKTNNYTNTTGYNKNLRISYTEVEALHKKSDALIPEQMVYFNSHKISGEKRYIYDSSNGSALGSTVDEASLHAMLELFERDAFLATWYGKIPPVRIQFDDNSFGNIHDYVDALKAKGIQTHLFDISMEMKIPTIWVLLEKEDPQENEMAFYTAAAASLDLEDALEKALIEATTAISVFENVFQNPDDQQRKKYLLDNPHLVTELEDHLLLYSNKEMKQAFTFALASPYQKTPAELETYYEHFSGSSTRIIEEWHEKIMCISPKAYRAVIQNPNLTVSGFVNVKYIVPEMLTMTFGHQNRRVVFSRIEKAIRLKERGLLDEEWIKSTPHPFP